MRYNNLERRNGVVYFKRRRFTPPYVPVGRIAPIPPLNPPNLLHLRWYQATQPWGYYTGTFNDYA